jgi:AraC-like DNA-binding protein
MELTLAEPAPQLSRYLLTYYLVSDEYAIIEDVQRADVGAVTFILNGDGHYDFRDGNRVEVTPAFLNGPTSASLTFSAFGPLRFVGASLQPGAWGHLVDASAAQFANTAGDAAPKIASDTSRLLEELRTKTTIAEMAPILDTFFLSIARPIPENQHRIIEKIRHWLASAFFPEIADLYGDIDLTRRQVTRISNRFFGAPPKILARKYAALRSASEIAQNGGKIPAHILTHYCDQSHVIREVRNFVGQTPRQLKIQARPLLLLTLQPEYYRELKPVP